MCELSTSISLDSRQASAVAGASANGTSPGHRSKTITALTRAEPALIVHRTFTERPLASSPAGFTVRVMATVLPLKKMSRVEKLRAMEAIWADLSRDEDQFESPAWHADALRETEQAVASGAAKFVDWEEAKKRLRRKAARLA